MLRYALVKIVQNMTKSYQNCPISLLETDAFEYLDIRKQKCIRIPENISEYKIIQAKLKWVNDVGNVRYKLYRYQKKIHLYGISSKRTVYSTLNFKVLKSYLKFQFILHSVFKYSNHCNIFFRFCEIYSCDLDDLDGLSSNFSVDVQIHLIFFYLYDHFSLRSKAEGMK